MEKNWVRAQPFSIPTTQPRLHNTTWERVGCRYFFFLNESKRKGDGGLLAPSTPNPPMVAYTSIYYSGGVELRTAMNTASQILLPHPVFFGAKKMFFPAGPLGDWNYCVVQKCNWPIGQVMDLIKSTSLTEKSTRPGLLDRTSFVHYLYWCGTMLWTQIFKQLWYKCTVYQFQYVRFGGWIVSLTDFKIEAVHKCIFFSFFFLL